MASSPMFQDKGGEGSRVKVKVQVIIVERKKGGVPLAAVHKDRRIGRTFFPGLVWARSGTI